jgi:hypothetical protein
MLPNFDGTTPLMAAAGVGTNEPQEEAGEESEAVNMLIDLGADLNTADKNGLSTEGQRPKSIDNYEKPTPPSSQK